MTRALLVLAALLGMAACGDRADASREGSRGLYVGGSGGINVSR